MVGTDAETKVGTPVQAALTLLRNRCFMRLLERIAARFNQAGVPLMVLKGGALNLTDPDALQGRPMSDLDLMVRQDDLGPARRILEESGCLRGGPLVREDFFPRYYYETEYQTSGIYRMKIDLHVRPLRPLRYARLMPDDALWDQAETVAVGAARVLIPSAEDMLIHLAAHAAVHGFSDPKWLNDIRRWVATRHQVLDGSALTSRAAAWGLALPVRRALERAEQEEGSEDIREEEGSAHPTATAYTLKPSHPHTLTPSHPHTLIPLYPSSWRDRLALWQAPRDAAHPSMHVLVNVLCTPGARFVLGYLRAVLLPDREHMGEWYCRRHWGWLPGAYLLRWVWPLIHRAPILWTWFHKIQMRSSEKRGIGVFATRDLKTGEVIAYSEIRGQLKYLKHNCRPNAQLMRSTLIALRPIRGEEEITIDYGEEACDCRRSRESPPSTVRARGEAA